MNEITLRIARPVSNLLLSRNMYCQGLGLQELGSFEEHAGFSGVILGNPQTPWHLEFTLCLAHPITPQPSAEDLLVVYLPDNAQWEHACQAMLEAGFVRTTSFNPYWDSQGQTFQDHDGYRTVIQCQQWPSN